MILFHYRIYNNTKQITLQTLERMIYEMPYHRDRTNDFWDNGLSGYSKDVCVRNFPNYTEKIDDIKEWFNKQKKFARRGYSRFLNLWIPRAALAALKFLKNKFLIVVIGRLNHEKWVRSQYGI